MKLIYKLLFCVSIVTFGCTNKPVVKDTLFLEKQPLRGQVLLTDDVLLKPEKLLVTDSFLIVSNRNDSLFLEVFRLPSLQNLGQFLSRGSGPEEFIYLGTMQRGFDNHSFYVSDFGSHKLFRYDLEDIAQARFVPHAVSLPDRNREIEGAQFTHYWLSPQGIIAQNITDKGRICLITPDTLLFEGDYPAPEKIDERLKDYPLANTMLYQSWATLSPAGDKLALACDLSDMIDVYSLAPDRATTDWSYWHSYPDEVVVMPNGEQYMAGSSMRSTYHYVDICSSDRFIFALYSGKKFGMPDYATGSHIRVVSWDQNISKEFETPDKLAAINIAPDGNILYGINQTEDGYEIKTYDLTGLL